MNTSSNNGGPAFPAADLYDANTGERMVTASQGMSLRDYFAAKALAAGVIANPPHNCDWSWHDYARDAYGMADAMLKAKEAS